MQRYLSLNCHSNEEMLKYDFHGFSHFIFTQSCTHFASLFWNRNRWSVKFLLYMYYVHIVSYYYYLYISYYITYNIKKEIIPMRNNV